MAGSHREEIERLESLYAENPEGRVFTHLAEAYRRAGDLDRAHQVLESGLLKHPEYSSAHVVLGRVRADEGDAEGAVEAFRRVIELDPYNMVALRTLGDLSRDLGRPAEAVSYYSELLVLDPAADDAADYVARHPGGVEPEEPDVWVEEEAPPAPAAWQEPEPDPWADVDTEAGPDEFEEMAGGGAGTESFDEAFGEPEPGAAETSTAGEREPPAEYASPEFSSEGFVADDAGRVMEEDTGEAIFPEQTGYYESTVYESFEERFGFPAAAGAEEQENGSADEPFPFESGAAETEEAEPGETGEVVTETIADLYLRQGLYRRAADVYRELLGQSPDDERLRTRLAEAEAEAEAAEEAAQAEFSPAPWEDGGYDPDVYDVEVFEMETVEVETVESAWTGGGGAWEDEGPYGWGEGAEEEEDPGAGRAGSIADYLSGLLEWNDEGAGAEPAEGEDAEAGEAEDAEAEDDEAVHAGAADLKSRDEDAASGAAVGPDDEDDLEMFRAWLQSLKH